MSKTDLTQLYYLRGVKLLRQKELCALLGVCRATLNNWEKKSGLPVIRKPSMRPLYDKEAVIDWLSGKENLISINQRVQKLQL